MILDWLALCLITALVATLAPLVVWRLRARRARRRETDRLAFAIRESRNLLQYAIDVARDGMAVYDRELQLVAWNNAYRDLFQLPPHLLRIGARIETLIRSNAERGLYGPGAIEPLVSARFDALTQPTDGMRLSTAPFGRVLEMRSIRLEDGGLFFTYTDATERAKTEDELELENEVLEARVRERTEELQHLNFELARAKAEAEDANISKTRFLAAASHDLLQPLNAARLYTTSLRERLRDEAAAEETLSLATNVDASLEAVEDILSALLEISHLDAGATTLELSAFPIEDILRPLRMEFGPIALTRGLRLSVLPSSLYVMSDRRLLRRLLQNLISNALKYTPKGRVLVGVRRLGASLRIDVCDTGIGIPRSKQQFIFREFTRLPAAAQVAPGIGLGLSIVERVSRVLEHRVRLRSRLGHGSMFSVTAARADAPIAATLGQTAARTIGRQRSLDGLVIATIDNERHILTGMEALLRGWNCIVASGVGLSDVEAALATLAVRPDVILADLHVGEIDGLEIIAALRRRHGHCPAVLITADRSPLVKIRAQSEDVWLLNKPLKPAALRALLSQWRLVKGLDRDPDGDPIATRHR